MLKGELTEKQALNMWIMTYRFMDNVKTYMDTVYKEKVGNITDNETSKMMEYIRDGLNDIVKGVLHVENKH